MSSKWGNDLRQTFRTIAQTAGVPELDVHLLMNHSIPGVNAGYITRNKLLRDHLRIQQELILAPGASCPRNPRKTAVWELRRSRKKKLGVTPGSAWRNSLRMLKSIRLSATSAVMPRPSDSTTDEVSAPGR